MVTVFINNLTLVMRDH